MTETAKGTPEVLAEGTQPTDGRTEGKLKKAAHDKDSTAALKATKPAKESRDSGEQTDKTRDPVKADGTKSKDIKIKKKEKQGDKDKPKREKAFSARGSPSLEHKRLKRGERSARAGNGKSGAYAVDPSTARKRKGSREEEKAQKSGARKLSIEDKGSQAPNKEKTEKQDSDSGLTDSGDAGKKPKRSHKDKTHGADSPNGKERSTEKKQKTKPKPKSHQPEAQAGDNHNAIVTSESSLPVRNRAITNAEEYLLPTPATSKVRYPPILLSRNNDSDSQEASSPAKEKRSRVHGKKVRIVSRIALT